MANKAKLHSPLHSNLKALVLQCVVEHCCGEELSPFWYQLQVLQFSVHLIDLLRILLIYNDFARIQKAVVDQTSSRPPNSDHRPFFGASWLWEML